MGNANSHNNESGSEIESDVGDHSDHGNRDSDRDSDHGDHDSDHSNRGDRDSDHSDHSDRGDRDSDHSDHSNRDSDHSNHSDHGDHDSDHANDPSQNVSEPESDATAPTMSITVQTTELMSPTPAPAPTPAPISSSTHIDKDSGRKIQFLTSDDVNLSNIVDNMWSGDECIDISVNGDCSAEESKGVIECGWDTCRRDDPDDPNEIHLFHEYKRNSKSNRIPNKFQLPIALYKHRLFTKSSVINALFSCVQEHGYWKNVIKFDEYSKMSIKEGILLFKKNKEIDCVSITSQPKKLKEVISNGDMVIFSFDVFNSINDCLDGMISIPTESEKSSGVHVAVIVGFHDEFQRFVVYDPWNFNTGDRGFLYFPYDYFNNGFSNDHWVIKNI